MAIQLKTGYAMTLVLLALAGGGAAALAAPAGTATAGAAARLPAAPAAQAGPTHSTTTLPAALRPVFYRALAMDAGAAYRINKVGCAALPKQTLRACFDGHGAHFSGAGSPLALRLTAYGRGDRFIAAESVKPAIAGNRASYVHGNLTEWWRVLPIGFEQGFTITKRPSGNGELTLALAMSPSNADSPFIRHSRAGGNPVEKGIPTGGRDTNAYWIPAFAGMTNKKNGNTLAWGKLRYGQLVVTDAKGKVVPATLTRKGDRVLIAVNDAHAAYPLTVDPLVWLEQKVTASDVAALDLFGTSVALVGTTALVGAPGHNNFQGAAYVFDESNGTWSQTQELTASDGVVGDQFGTAVALSGTTALVGAAYATVNGNYAQGAAYVFGESGGSWTQTAKLSASDGAADDAFGTSVALDGTTAMVGAQHATVNGNPVQGAAYVFGESGGSWSEMQKLSASDGAVDDHFGSSVALSGTTALVGAYHATVNGNPVQGAAYVFTELFEGFWSQTQKLTASDGAAGDEFGTSVALVGTTALVGAPFATVNGNGAQGAAYVFGESGGSWTQTAELVASDGAADDAFGWSVALSGTTALVGAYGHNSYQGAAYVFGEAGGSWTQTAELAASDGAAYDSFGYSVALSGTTALVGTPRAAVNDLNGQAYFEGKSDLGLAVSAPQSVNQGQQYSSQTIATNNASAASPAVSTTITVPAAASFISVTASQGTCGEAYGVVTCDFGQIPSNAGTATANVTLKAIGSGGTTIDNTATVTKATPPLTAGAPTAIVACPAGYIEYDGSLSLGSTTGVPSYQAPAGEENTILTAPAGIRLALMLNDAQGRKTYVFPSNEVHRWGPAGTYRWLVRAKSGSGAYTLCILHP